MNMRERANQAARSVCEALSVDANAKQFDVVVGIVEQAIIDAILEATRQSGEAVMECCSPDLDMAHKVSEEIRRRQGALVTNLKSLR